MVMMKTIMVINDDGDEDEGEDNGDDDNNDGDDKFQRQTYQFVH